MKRLLSLALAAAVLAALALPAAAEEPSADARLAKVTQAVKDALDLDTSIYESFHGGCTEDLVPVWDLNWEHEGSTLYIQALEDGTVTSLYRWEQNGSAAYRFQDFPVFPESGGEDAKAVARDFLDRVLRPNETVELKDPVDGLYSGRSSRSWEGRVSINGLPTPLNWHLSVENGQVLNFSRETPEASYVGAVPSPEAPADKAKAEADLKETLKLRLEYVREDPQSKQTVLRYVPENVHEFLVDAKTGQLLDLTELEKLLSETGVRATAGGAAEDAAAPEALANKRAFTDAEQEGIREMEGTLDKETLDKALRDVSAYGLQGYALSSVSYQKDGENLWCTLRYGRISGENRHYRTFRVDAKTGAVQSIYSTSPWNQEAALTEAEAREKAEAFLKVFCPDRSVAFCENPNYTTQDGAPFYRFFFARVENDLFFPDNAYSVSIDSSDGSVYGLSFTWDEELSFPKPEGLVSPEAALRTWAGTYDVTLAYRQIPQSLNKAVPLQARLLEQGMESCPALRLTYALERETRYSGIDARTGQPAAEEERTTRAALSYTDLSGSAARADVEKLAQYGVGYAAERFRPGKTLTQWELVALLSSLRGTALDPDAVEKGSERDSAYSIAYSMGALQPAQRSDDAIVTRSALVRMLLDAAGYGPAARLEGGIFTCSYTDRASIPDEGLGYAAVAQALGMASSVYGGERSATRGEAASMLCRVLERAL